MHKKYRCKVLDASDFSVAVDFMVLIFVYMPTDYRDEYSAQNHVMACALLLKISHRVWSLGKELIIYCDVNTHLSKSASPFS